MKTIKSLFLFVFAFSALNAQNTKSAEIEPMETGIYEASWESLKQYGEAPEWFRNAKFGIWAHWGPQCEPEEGDWYARSIYYPGQWKYDAHISKYGNPRDFGFKDVINVWKADKWNPEKLVALYKKTGAQYFVALANHHDNMDLWDSKYQPWNSVNMGPKRDILAEWAEVSKNNGLPFGISIHASHAWTWYEGSQDYDGNLTKEDGEGKWWEGYDPQDLYAQNHPRSTGSDNIGNIHKQWNWGNGASQPSDEYCNKFYNRTIDAINKYNPDVIYFDDTALPFYPINNVGTRIAAHTYNKSLKENKTQEAVILGKVLNEDQKECMVWDIERGIPDGIQEKFWQTCTCLGTWHYEKSFYDNNRYKSAKTVIHLLVDIVSKNGNLLLSVPMRGDGTIDDKEEAILKGIADWMDINKESIYGTRPWKVFGEGPTADKTNPMRGQGFNENIKYSNQDIRYVMKDNMLYATVMGWPDDGKVTLKSLAASSANYTGKVKKVELLGYGKLDIISRNEEGLTIKLPANRTNDIALVFKIPLDLAAFAQAQSYQKTDLGIKSTVNSTVTEIQVYSPTIIRIVKSPEGVPFTKESLSVIKEPQKTAFSIKQNGDLVTVKTAKIDVNLNTQNGKVSFSTKKTGNLLAEETSAVFTDFNDAGNKTYSVTQTFKLMQDEDIYGLGQHQHGKMSQRNSKLKMVQNNKDDYVPFFVSTKGYGLFWDNYSPTIFEDKPECTLFNSEVGDCVDYYFMFGENMDGSIACMRDLTGQVPMFPLWTYGFWQSKERYKSQDETAGVVRKYRELSVPLDGIIQDWQYWDSNYLWNAMEFLSPQFRNPKKMIEDIHNMNAHIIISIWSSFGPKTKQYREMEPKGMLLNFDTWPQSGIDAWPPKRDYPSGVKPYDPYNPEARDIYWKYLNQGLFSLDIDGWWMDSTEPDHINPKPADFDNKTYLGSLRKVRNAYPLMTVGGVYQNQRKVSSDKRVFILTRSAFAGQQRYGANTWTGDVNSTWDALRKQIPAGLNFTLSAIPHWNSDIGGFFAGAYNDSSDDGTATKNPAYQELYVRWMQFGAFCPMMRSHGTNISREIYHFGEKGEPVYDAIAKAIELRYSLLPYIYSTSWEVTDKQGSFMRALAMDFDDKKVRNTNDKYMFGRSILVAPVVNAQYTPEKVVKTNEVTGWGKTNSEDGNKTTSTIDFTQPKSTKIYLPAGTVWYDLWTNEKIDGGQEVTVETKIDMIPLYVKQGSIIPFGPQVQFATEKNWENIEIRVYPGVNGEFTLYEDENDNYNYEKGIYSTITFKWNDKSKTLTISDRKGSFPGMLNNRKFKVVLAGKSDTCKEVEYKGKATSVKL